MTTLTPINHLRKEPRTQKSY